MSENNTQNCLFCGEELNKRNKIGEVCVCLDCQRKRYKALEEKNGAHLAIFLACAAFDLPCYPSIIPLELSKAEGEKWDIYINALIENDKLYRGDTPRNFLDGESDIRRIFGRELSEKDFARYIAAEQERVAKLEGNGEQRDRWGTEMNYKTADYDELDRRYFNRLETYKGVSLTPQVIDLLIKVCKYDYEGDKAMVAGDTRKAKDIYDIIDKMLASENLRKKDEKPVEHFRIDAQVDALERAGLMENGAFKPLDELQKSMWKLLKAKKYDYSLDVLDHMILDNYNNMRANADSFFITELPDDLIENDEWHEFADEETETERKNKEYAGLAKLRPNKKGGK